MPFRFVDAVFWAAVGCCVIAQCAILHSVLRASPTRQSGQSATGAQSVSARHRIGEIAFAVIPGIALAFVLLYTWRAMR